MLVYLVLVEVEVVVLLRSPRIQRLSLKTLDFLPLTDRVETVSTARFRRTKTQKGDKLGPKRVVTCPSTGEGEEPVVMVAGVKAERCRSCAEGTLRDGF